MSHQPITIAYSLRFRAAMPEEISSIMERLRQSVNSPVGELVHLFGPACVNDPRLVKRFVMLETGDLVVWPDEAIFFLVGEEAFGLAAYPLQVVDDFGTAIADTGLVGWFWSSVLRTSDLVAIRKLLHVAAEEGIETSQNVAGMAITATLGDDGKVQYEHEWAIQDG